MMNDNGNNNLRIAEVKEEINALNRRKETRAYILFIITQLIRTIQGLQLKSFYSLFSSIYDLNSLVFWRHLGIASTAYLFIRYKKIKFTYPSQIHYRKWFYIRNVGIYICIYTWMKSLYNLRLSTCQILSGVNPLMTIIYSILFLKEKFRLIYFIGIMICFSGSAIIILNERKLEEGNVNNNNLGGNIFIGLLSITINVNLNALGNVGVKFMCIEHLTPEEQTFYFGFYSTIISCFCCLVNFKFGFSNIYYILYSYANGIIFFFANYLTSISFQNIEISKLQQVAFLSSILIILSGTIIFNEKLFVSDILGAAMIIGFIIYNGMHRPKSK